MIEHRLIVVLAAVLGLSPAGLHATPIDHRHPVPAPHHRSAATPKHRSAPTRPNLAVSEKRLASRAVYPSRDQGEADTPTRLSVEQPLGVNGIVGSVGYQRDRVGAIDSHEVNSAVGVQLDRSYSLVGARVSYVFK